MPRATLCCHMKRQQATWPLDQIVLLVNHVVMHMDSSCSILEAYSTHRDSKDPSNGLCLRRGCVLVSTDNTSERVSSKNRSHFLCRECTRHNIDTC